MIAFDLFYLSIMQGQLYKSVSIFATSRFHYQQLAQQLICRDLLCNWITALPLRKIPFEFHSAVISKPLSLYIHLFSQKVCRGFARDLIPFMNYYANSLFDSQSLALLRHSSPQVVIGLSHNFSAAGDYSLENGGRFYCDVPIAHPTWLNQVLSEEYSKLQIHYSPIHPRQIDLEMLAHGRANKVVCPSSFVKNTLVANGLKSDKVVVIPYGSSQVLKNSITGVEQNMKPILADTFSILFVGQMSPRKGIHYLIDAFSRFKHPNKKLILAGPLCDEAKHILSHKNLDRVCVLGMQTKEQLHRLYLSATVFVLPSIAEGLALVIGEAMSYGLPIIYTPETGAEEILTNGVEGVMIKSCKTQAIVDAFQMLADDQHKTNAMSHAAKLKSLRLSGWGSYGDLWENLITSPV